MDIKHGFEPFFDENSVVLILGSFPSVKSRQVEFYYGNRQNRFWKRYADISARKRLLTLLGRKNFLRGGISRCGIWLQSAKSSGRRTAR